MKNLSRSPSERDPSRCIGGGRAATRSAAQVRCTPPLHLRLTRRERSRQLTMLRAGSQSAGTAPGSCPRMCASTWARRPAKFSHPGCAESAAMHPGTGQCNCAPPPPATSIGTSPSSASCIGVSTPAATTTRGRSPPTGVPGLASHGQIQSK